MLTDDSTEIQTKKEAYHVPPYKPEHIPSPEFGGTSNYEVGITDLVKEKMERLEKLRRDPQTNPVLIQKAEDDLRTLDNMYENFHIGMNVFRTAKGGRDKIRE